MKIIFTLLLAITLSSCGLFKKVTRSVDRQETQTNQEVKKDSIGTTIDKSITTIKEETDTVIKTPEKTTVTEQYVNMDSLISAVTNIKNDLFLVKLDYNKATGILRTTTTLLPQKHTIHFNKLTTKQNDITTNSAVKQKAITNSKSKGKFVVAKKEPAKMGIWLIAVLVGVAILIGSFIYWFKKRLP